MRRASLVLVAVVLLLCGCSGIGGGPTVSPSPDALQTRLLGIAGVATVFDSADHGENSAAHPFDPAHETREIDIALDPALDDARQVAVVTAVITATRDVVGKATIYLDSGDGEAVSADDLPVPPAWRVRLRPDTGRDVVADVRAAQRVVALDGVRVDLTGFPDVDIDDEARFSDLWRRISVVPPFSGGAEYALAGEARDHLTIVDRTERTSPHAVEALIAIAAQHPDAEVLLQSETTRNPLPTVYISHLTPDEQTSVAAELADPALADADVDGYPVPFVVSSSGLPDRTGTLGSVPDS